MSDGIWNSFACDNRAVMISVGVVPINGVEVTNL